tara:strand:+ start:35939 stop:36301 length:363 start_codon:yes stop_codon:yes gene_type:complete
MEFILIRAYYNIQGDLYFEEMNCPLRMGRGLGFLAQVQLAEKIVCIKVLENHDMDSNGVPKREYVIVLDEVIKRKAPNGDKRLFSIEDILSLRNTQWKHLTKDLKKKIKACLQNEKQCTK